MHFTISIYATLHQQPKDGNFDYFVPYYIQKGNH
jgi:hypothetical protein